MLDRAAEWGIPPGVIVADAGYGGIAKFREEIAGRSLDYVVGVESGTGVWEEPVSGGIPPYRGIGRPRKRPANLPKTRSVARMAEELPAEAWKTVIWREGTKGELQGRFTARRVQPSHGHEDGKTDQKSVWLLAEWPEGEERPTRFWWTGTCRLCGRPIQEPVTLGGSWHT